MRFRVLTYNIHKGIGIDHRFAPERIVAILRHHDADVALLQEVDHGVPRSRYMDLASYLAHELKYPHHALGLNVYMRRGRYGNATLSRFPIGRQRNIDLTVGRHKRRGGQHTRVHVPCNGHEMHVDVFNVHLGLSGHVRRRQVERLLAAQDVSGLPSDSPCVIGGDMNDWGGVLKRLFRPAGFACATNRSPGSRWSIKTFPSFAPTTGLDKVFYRGALRLEHTHRSRLKVARVASDHLPVVVDFAL
jgi:endonuclease/exonuclease/phosphatase family metal-dependent hydrolase